MSSFQNLNSTTLLTYLEIVQVKFSAAMMMLSMQRETGMTLFSVMTLLEGAAHT